MFPRPNSLPPPPPPPVPKGGPEPSATPGASHQINWWNPLYLCLGVLAGLLLVILDAQQVADDSGPRPQPTPSVALRALPVCFLLTLGLLYIQRNYYLSDLKDRLPKMQLRLHDLLGLSFCSGILMLGFPPIQGAAILGVLIPGMVLGLMLAAEAGHKQGVLRFLFALLNASRIIGWMSIGPVVILWKYTNYVGNANEGLLATLLFMGVQRAPFHTHALAQIAAVLSCTVITGPLLYLSIHPLFFPKTESGKPLGKENVPRPYPESPARVMLYAAASVFFTLLWLGIYFGLYQHRDDSPPSGGMSGISLSGTKLLFFGAAITSALLVLPVTLSMAFISLRERRTLFGWLAIFMSIAAALFEAQLWLRGR